MRLCGLVLRCWVDGWAGDRKDVIWDLPLGNFLNGK